MNITTKSDGNKEERKVWFFLEYKNTCTTSAYGCFPSAMSLRIDTLSPKCWNDNKRLKKKHTSNCDLICLFIIHIRTTDTF